MKKRIIGGGILAVFTILMIVAGSRIKPVKQENIAEKEVKSSFKLGVILPSDETEDETKEHMDAIAEAAESSGISLSEIVWKERTGEGKAKGAARELLAEDCTMILAANSCHAAEMTEFAEENPEIHVITVTDTEILQRSENLSTIQMDTKEACYIAGVAAGVKLKDLHEKGQIPEDDYQSDGKVKIGYVAKYEEERSREECTQFLGGVRSVFSKVTMEIRYTGMRLDLDAEASAADTLIRSGCIMIGCNTESSRVADVVARARENKKKVWFIGYHNGEPDGSGSEYAGIVKEWPLYYRELFEAVAAEKEIPSVWKKGYEENAVTIWLAKKGVVKGTRERIEKAGQIP